MRLRLPIGTEWRSTLQMWAAEIRSVDFITEDDFTPKQWDSVITARGAMALTNIRLIYSNYVKIGKMIFVNMYADFTTGGVADYAIYATLPFQGKQVPPQNSILEASLASSVFDNGALAGATAVGDTTSLSRAQITRYDQVAWTLGANRAFWLTGFYWTD